LLSRRVACLLRFVHAPCPCRIKTTIESPDSLNTLAFFVIEGTSEHSLSQGGRLTSYHQLKKRLSSRPCGSSSPPLGRWPSCPARLLSQGYARLRKLYWRSETSNSKIGGYNLRFPHRRVESSFLPKIRSKSTESSK
jgi:hypothetical protein